MFKLTDRFWWPVVLEVPGDGTTVKHKIEVEYKRKTQQEVDTLREAAKTDEEICLEVVTGWKGVKGDDGEELQFSPSNLQQLLDEITGARFTIVTTYFEAMQGAARRKNFQAARGIG
jgi:hypothetical protein